VYFVVLIFGFADMAEDFAPRLPGAGVALEFVERLVERLPFGRGGRAAVQQVGFVKFGEPGEELGTVADGQPGQFFKNLSFAHGVNLARSGFSRKRGMTCQFQFHGGIFGLRPAFDHAP
jgi:hypothetical protein